MPPLSTRESNLAVSPRFPDSKDVETQTRINQSKPAPAKDDKESLDTLLSSAGARDFKKRHYNNVSDSFETFGNAGPGPILQIAEDWEPAISYEKKASIECGTPDVVLKDECPITESSLGDYLPKKSLVRDKKHSGKSTDTCWAKDKLDVLVDESRRFDDSVSMIIHETSFSEAAELQKQILSLQQQLNMEREQWMQHTREMNSSHQLEMDELTQFYENKMREMRKKTDSFSKLEPEKAKHKMLEPDAIQDLKDLHEREKQALERRYRAECELKLEQQREKLYRENQENLHRLRESLKEEHEKEYNYLREQLMLRLSANESRVKQSNSPKLKLDISLSDKEIDSKVRDKLESLKGDYERRISFLEREKEDLRKQLSTSELRSHRRPSHSTECSSAGQTLELENMTPGAQDRRRCTGNQVLCTKCKTFVQAEGELSQQLSKFRRLLES